MSFLFKELLRPYYSRKLWYSRNCYGLVKFKDHCSVLVIQGITVVFQLFNCGVFIIQATTVSLKLNELYYLKGVANNNTNSLHAKVQDYAHHVRCFQSRLCSMALLIRNNGVSLLIRTHCHDY